MAAYEQVRCILYQTVPNETVIPRWASPDVYHTHVYILTFETKVFRKVAAEFSAIDVTINRFEGFKTS